MNKYILVAFAFMAFAFYELSGGDDFVPGDNRIQMFAEAKPYVPAPEPKSEPRPVAQAQPAPDLDSLTAISVARAALFTARDVPLDPTPVIPRTVSTTAQAPATPLQEAKQQAVVVAEPDLRLVTGDRVNLRGGPGTDHGVVAKLLRDDTIEVLKDDGSGWLHLRVIDTGDEGWIADWLVTAAN